MSDEQMPSRILMTADTIGGVWTYALELAAGLCERGARVTLAAMGRLPSERQRAEAAAIERLRLEARPYRLEWMEDPWEDLEEAGGWLEEIAKECEPDLVHLNTLAHGAIDWSAPVLSVGHSCVLSWFEAVKGHPAPPRWEHYRDRVAESLRKSDCVAAPTRAMLSCLERHYGPFERAAVVYNGRSQKMFAPETGEEVVLSAGRLWDEAKNVGALASVADSLSWPVVVAGDQMHPDGSRVEFDGVRSLGRLEPDQLADWYRRASIYALPARYEPFGLTALEAALSENALVLGAIPTLEEIWGEAAIFVDPDNLDEIAGAIEELAGDAERREEMAARARRRARQLGVASMVDAYQALYGAMLDEGSHLLSIGSFARRSSR